MLTPKGKIVELRNQKSKWLTNPDKIVELNAYQTQLKTKLNWIAGVMGIPGRLAAEQVIANRS